MSAEGDPGRGLPAPRRYSDREVARILERATELQRAEPSAMNPEGLTLTELTEIAREAGIEPAMLRRAASELAATTPARTLAARLAGAPVSIRVERVVEGELSPERFDAIIPRIQQATDGQGTASAVGRTLTWSSQNTENTTSQQVLISSGEGRTLIRWEERFSGLAGALFGGIVGGAGVGLGVGGGGAIAGILGSAALGVGIPVAALAGSYGLARTLFHRVVRKREAAALEVVDEIAVFVAGMQPNAAARLPEEGTAAPE